MSDSSKKLVERPPVIVIMGHIDHGKSTLLDYIRKTNITEKETGGITQHIGAYEVTYSKEGKEHKITFLDTPGHEAFGALRSRGARVADIGILVVSAEEGVKPQTLEAIETFKKEKIPFIVAINKIDKPEANIERTKQSLAENEVFLESFGGHVSWTAISSKAGTGVPELLDLILLTTEFEELKAEPDAQAEGTVIESHLDTKKGIVATVIITNGTLKSGEFAVCGKSISPLRIIENFKGEKIDRATFSSPVRIIGWDLTPEVGMEMKIYPDKKSALDAVAEFKMTAKEERKNNIKSEKTKIPIVLKVDTGGSLDAIIYEINKLVNERIEPKIILSGIGTISENDIRSAESNSAIVIGFNNKVEPQAQSLADRLDIKINSFDIIYKLTEWLEAELKERTPKIEQEEVTGRAKILKLFSLNKDKQIVGGKVESGTIGVNEAVKILRRDTEIGRGRIRELQIQKIKTGSVAEGNEFGTMIEARIEIAPGDRIESFTIVKK